jgi:predicted RNase H-like HicB family nuclease
MSRNLNSTTPKSDNFERFLEEAKKKISNYHIVLEKSEGLGYIGSSIEMPTVFADGKTADKCVEATKEALEIVAATMLEEGKEPPIPYSGKKRQFQVNLRLSGDEKNLLLKAAKYCGFRSISDFVRNCAIERVRSSHL